MYIHARIMQDEDRLFHWDVLSGQLSHETAETLLKDVMDLYTYDMHACMHSPPMIGGLVLPISCFIKQLMNHIGAEALSI